ncbi:MAG: hypothetical protein WBW94_08985 [Anaerolineales bacterium]
MANIIMGCTTNSGINNGKIDAYLLDFPQAGYTDLVTIDNRLIAFAEKDTLSQNGDGLVQEETSYLYASEGDTSLTHFELPSDEICPQDFARYSHFKNLPDGRIGIIKTCFGLFTGNRFQDHSFMLAYDWHSQKLEQLVKGTLGEWIEAGDFTWNPSLTRGIHYDTHGTIYWMTPTGIAPMHIQVYDQGTEWYLDEIHYDATYNPDLCTGDSTAPAWSPDGLTISFFASGDVKNRNCPPHTLFRYDLYFMDPNILRPTLALSGVTAPAFSLWSPNSKRIVFSGRTGPQNQFGLWLFTPETNSLELIDTGYFYNAIWISNRDIAAIKCFETEISACGRTEIWKYGVNVAKVLSKSR